MVFGAPGRRRKGKISERKRVREKGERGGREDGMVKVNVKLKVKYERGDNPRASYGLPHQLLTTL